KERINEFYDSEVAVTVQRYHRKAWDKRNLSSTIHGHGMLKFPVNGEIVTICSIIMMPTECTTIATTPKEAAKKAEAHHRNFKVAIHPEFPDQEITIGGTISTKARTELCTLLKGNLDIFTWQPSYMTSVPRSIAEHRLNIREGYSPVSQKSGAALGACQGDPIRGTKLVEAGTMREVYYHDWLSNPVMVKKHDGSWRIRRNVSRIHDQSGKDKTMRRQDGGRVTAPISKSAKKSLPLFKTLKRCIKKSNFHWTPDAKQAFKQLKQHLTKLPMLVAPKPKEELIMYLSASYGAISTVLMTERDTVQTLVFFVSRVLQALELNYTPMEKLVLALVCATKRLRRYFHAHPIVVITDQPIKQILTDFLVKKPDDAPPEASVIETPQDSWTLFMNGSSCVDGSEYEALIAGLQIAVQMGVRNVYLSVNSKLVANQVLGTYVAKEDNMIKYLEKTKSLISGFANLSISQVPRSKNKKADALSKIASTSFAHLSKQVLDEILKEKSIQEKEMATVLEEEGPTWMTPIIEYLRDGTLPKNQKEARKLCIKARQYKLLEGILYRRSFLKPWLRCVRPLQEDYVMQEIYEGSCSMHVGPRFVVAKAMRSGYYWPTMHQDAREMIRKCKNCQIHHLVPRSLGEGIKARLAEGNKNWLEELPHVLWAHRTMIKSSNNDTLFSLTYGTEAVIHAEIRVSTYRTAVVDVVHNDEELWLNLDLLEERHERATICEAKANSNMRKCYNARVRGVTFRPGDFVYRSNDASHAMDGGKLGPK
nr:reverse transcriptase domain-containing protein [Tanacetum cinerariifolium]